MTASNRVTTLAPEPAMVARYSARIMFGLGAVQSQNLNWNKPKAGR